IRRLAFFSENKCRCTRPVVSKCKVNRIVFCKRKINPRIGSSRPTHSLWGSHTNEHIFLKQSNGTAHITRMSIELYIHYQTVRDAVIIVCGESKSKRFPL